MPMPRTGCNIAAGAAAGIGDAVSARPTVHPRREVHGTTRTAEVSAWECLSSVACGHFTAGGAKCSQTVRHAPHRGVRPPLRIMLRMMCGPLRRARVGVLWVALWVCVRTAPGRGESREKRVALAVRAGSTPSCEVVLRHCPRM